MSTALHVVIQEISGVDRKAAPQIGVVGAFTDQVTADAVNRVAGSAWVASIRLNEIQPGHATLMRELGLNAPATTVSKPGQASLATLADVLAIGSDADFEQVLHELPVTLHQMRAASATEGFTGHLWPIEWRADAPPGAFSSFEVEGKVSHSLGVSPAGEESLPLPDLSGFDADTQRRLTACWRALDGVPLEKFEGKTIAEYVSKEAYLHSLNANHAGTGTSMELSGLACQMLTESFAGQFVGSGAINFLEVGLDHEEIGPFTVTIQRRQGQTPGALRAEALQELEIAKAALLARDVPFDAGQTAEFWALAHDWARSTLDTPKRAAALLSFVASHGAPVDVVAAMGGYLRTCRSGGMSRKSSDTIAAAVAEAQSLGYFTVPQTHD